MTSRESSFSQSVKRLKRRRNKLGNAVEILKKYRQISEIRHGFDPAKAEITSDKMIIGKFVDIEKPTYGELLRRQFANIQEELAGEKRQCM